MYLPDEILAQMAAPTARHAFLAEFGFADGVRRVWEGTHRVITPDGHGWDGLSVLGSISGLAQTQNGAAPPLEFTLSGVDAGFAAKVKGDRANWYLRPAIVYWLFFDERWQPIGNPRACRFGLIQNMTATRTWDGEQKQHIYTVGLRAEGLFIGQGRARNAYYTDADQKRRSAGDRFFDRVAGIEGKVIQWP
ncbi:hypothetical protein KHC28_00435 [Ancylobacter sonchi]|uniref:hypothetical protein n=1 Tax=Ancylobacter sonchi TaxID=1937790 RepID=UPI001BD50BA2|nr:hypothetical protein [Ancylobacter sonchi]MBS7532132.1 hypothetical protein [Ancylobacter sonchi]